MSLHGTVRLLILFYHLSACNQTAFEAIQRGQESQGLERDKKDSLNGNLLYEHLDKQDYRAIKKSLKPDYKDIRRAFGMGSPNWLTLYLPLIRHMKAGNINKLVELSANWKHEPTRNTARYIIDTYLRRCEARNAKIKDQKNIDLAMAKTQAAEEAIKAREKAQDDIENFKPIDQTLIDDIKYMASQTHHGEAHVHRWSRALAALGVDNGFTPMTLSEAEASVKKYSSPLWKQIAKILREEARLITVSEDMEKAEKVKDKLNSMKKPFESLEAITPFKVVGTVEQSGEDQEPDKIVIEAVQEAKAAQVVKEEVAKRD